jgi:hypothetical protein
MDVKIRAEIVSGTHFKITVKDLNENVVSESGEILYSHPTGQLFSVDTVNDLLEQNKNMNSDWNFIETVNDFE